MKDKYYTPEIEEFHVGFEFEFQGVDGHWNLTGWDKHIIGTTEGEVGTWRACLSLVQKCYNNGNQKISEQHFRVKYLDREDIESLGWSLRPTQPEKGFYFWDDKTETHSIIYIPQNNWTLITMYNADRGEDYTAFAGCIKNKSELKRLLKQLGI